MINRVKEMRKQGMGLKQISEELEMNYEAVKKLATLATLYERSKDYLTEENFNKLVALGTKGLIISSLATKGDFAGLEDILSCIEVDINREELKKLPKALAAKRKDVELAISEVEKNKVTLQKKVETIERDIKNNNAILAEIEDKIVFLKLTTHKGTKEALLYYVGVCEGEYVLARRLYHTAMQYLKQIGVIVFSDTFFLWIITDIEKFVKYIERRVISKKKIEFDPSETNHYTISDVFKRANTVDTENYKGKLEKLNKQIQSLEYEKSRINKEIKHIKSRSASDYLGSVEIANSTYKYNQLEHQTLQDQALKFLYKNDYVAAVEIRTNKYRFDTLGYNAENNLVMIEAKVRLGDLKRDQKIANYLKYCNEFYLITSNLDVEFYALSEPSLQTAGVIFVDRKNNNKITLRREPTKNTEKIPMCEELKFLISRMLTKKIVYGF